MVILLYQRLGAMFMSMHQFDLLFCLENQAFTPDLLVGKLSYIKMQMKKTKCTSWLNLEMCKLKK